MQPGGVMQGKGEVREGIMVKKMALRVQHDTNSSCYKKINNRQSSVSPIYNFDGQQRLDGAADWSAAQGGRVLPHFEHTVSGASTLSQLYFNSSAAGCPLLVDGRSSVNRPQLGLSGLRRFPSKRITYPNGCQCSEQQAQSC